MNIEEFITQSSRNSESVISVIEQNEPKLIIEMSAFVLSITPSELEELEIFNKSYSDNIKLLKKNVIYLRQLCKAACDHDSEVTLAGILRYMIVPYENFVRNISKKELDTCLNNDESIFLSYKEAINSEIIRQKSLIKKSSGNFIVELNTISDLWNSFKLTKVLRPESELYIRAISDKDDWKVCLVFARNRKDEKNYNKKSSRKIVTLHYGPGWTNTELTKDCGFIPYLMYKNHNCDSYMIGVKKDNYTYLDTYVKGMNMEFLETGSEEEKQEYIRNNAAEIDGLLLRGSYPSNYEIADLYKKYNPDGKIYVGLDANSHWMDRIKWDEPDFIHFMENCDVIATSCTAMQEHLNRKWPWKIEYIPNGYIKYSDDYSKPVFSEKNNVILTVSRLGTPQKATEVLLESFALIADKIPEWTLKLVGSVESGFETYIDEYFIRHPELKSRVIFAGRISDKNQLTEEYRKSKIFALPSTFEGGTPNVVAEALAAGCVMAVTKIDAWEDAVDSGRCGLAAEINDISGFAGVLFKLCTDDSLEEKSKNAYLHAVHNFDMEQVVARIYDMMFGGVPE